MVVVVDFSPYNGTWCLQKEWFLCEMYAVCGRTANNKLRMWHGLTFYLGNRFLFAMSWMFLLQTELLCKYMECMGEYDVGSIYSVMWENVMFADTVMMCPEWVWYPQSENSNSSSLCRFLIMINNIVRMMVHSSLLLSSSWDPGLLLNIVIYYIIGWALLKYLFGGLSSISSVNAHS